MRLPLADDHRIVRDGLRQMLSDEPDIDIVGEATDGQQLLYQLRNRPSEADVVPLDIRMPGVGGLEFLERLAEEPRQPTPAIIVLSMHHEPAIVRRAVELGADGYLLKNSTREQQLAALRHVEAGNGCVQAEIDHAHVVLPSPAHWDSPPHRG